VCVASRKFAMAPAAPRPRFLALMLALLPANLFGDERGSRHFAVQAMFEFDIWPDGKVDY